MAYEAAFLGLPNLADAGTLTASSEALPVENLQTVQPREVWRSTGLTNQDIDVDLGAEYAIDSIVLVNHNLTSAGTWRIYCDDNSSSFASPTYDPGAANVDEATINATVRGKLQLAAVRVLDSTVQARYVRIRLNVAGNAAGYLQAGRLIVCAAFKVLLERPLELGVKDLSVVEVAERTGTPWREERDRIRTAKYTLANRTENEMFGTFFPWIMTVKGVGGDLFVVPRPSQTGYYHLTAAYQRIVKFDDLANKVAGDRFSGALECEEWR